MRIATNGMKEADTNLTSVLNCLFLPLPHKRVKELGLKESEEALYVSRLSREIEACGKDASVATGNISAKSWVIRATHTG